MNLLLFSGRIILSKTNALIISNIALLSSDINTANNPQQITKKMKRLEILILILFSLNRYMR